MKGSEGLFMLLKQSFTVCIIHIYRTIYEKNPQFLLDFNDLQEIIPSTICSRTFSADFLVMMICRRTPFAVLCSSLSIQLRRCSGAQVDGSSIHSCFSFHLAPFCCWFSGYVISHVLLCLQDKQKEGLSEKLCHRFPGTSGRPWAIPVRCKLYYRAMTSAQYKSHSCVW